MALKQVVHVFGKIYDLVPVKTRLANDIGRETAKEVYKIIFRHIVKSIAGTEYDQILFIDPRASEGFLKDLGWTHQYVTQVGNDLGARINHAFQTGAVLGYEKQIVISSDAPGLNANIVLDAFHNLDKFDLVVAPSIDGGFSLIGLKYPIPELVTDVEWSSATTLDTLLTQAKRLEFKWKLLSFINDIDNQRDLEDFLWKKKDYSLHNLQIEIKAKLKNQYFNSPQISVIIPALNEEKQLGYTLISLKSQLDTQDEVIVVDGRSIDQTAEIARRYGAQVLISERGRALQMNSGAGQARGEVLLFLHADCQLEEQGIKAMKQVLRNTKVLGGCFSQEITGSQKIYGWIARSGNWRARFLRIFYGDQGIFVRREVFEKIGGFPKVQLFEDVLFSRNLKKLGPTVVLARKIQTTPRAWKSWGIVKVSVRNWMISILFYLGCSPNWLKRFYPDIR